MALYNTSSAYDLSAFDPAVREEKAAPALKVVKNTRAAPSSVFSFKTVTAFLVVASLICLMVYNQSQLNELTRQISRYNSEIDALRSQNVEMTSALESMVHGQEIADLAEQLGMQKRDEFQTKRIYLYNDDRIERAAAAPAPTTSDSAKLVITSLFGQIKEYLAN